MNDMNGKESFYCSTHSNRVYNGCLWVDIAGGESKGSEYFLHIILRLHHAVP